MLDRVRGLITHSTGVQQRNRCGWQRTEGLTTLANGFTRRQSARDRVLGFYAPVVRRRCRRPADPRRGAGLSRAAFRAACVPTRKAGLRFRARTAVCCNRCVATEGSTAFRAMAPASSRSLRRDIARANPGRHPAILFRRPAADGGGAPLVFTRRVRACNDRLCERSEQPRMPTRSATHRRHFVWRASRRRIWPSRRAWKVPASLGAMMRPLEPCHRPTERCNTRLYDAAAIRRHGRRRPRGRSEPHTFAGAHVHSSCRSRHIGPLCRRSHSVSPRATPGATTSAALASRAGGLRPCIAIASSTRAGAMAAVAVSTSRTVARRAGRAMSPAAVTSRRAGTRAHCDKRLRIPSLAADALQTRRVPRTPIP